MASSDSWKLQQQKQKDQEEQNQLSCTSDNRRRPRHRRHRRRSSSSSIDRWTLQYTLRSPKLQFIARPRQTILQIHVLKCGIEDLFHLLRRAFG